LPNYYTCATITTRHTNNSIIPMYKSEGARLRKLQGINKANTVRKRHKGLH